MANVTLLSKFESSFTNALKLLAARGFKSARLSQSESGSICTDKSEIRRFKTRATGESPKRSSPSDEPISITKLAAASSMTSVSILSRTWREKRPSWDGSVASSIFPKLSITFWVALRTAATCRVDASLRNRLSDWISIRNLVLPS